MIFEIGKIDKNKLGKFKDKIITEDVIITDERIQHIIERHGDDWELFNKYITNILAEPDYILEDSKNEDTVIILKQVNILGKNIQVIIKLVTNEEERKNSIITLSKVRNKTYKQMIRNKKVLYKNE